MIRSRNFMLILSIITIAALSACSSTATTRPTLAPEAQAPAGVVAQGHLEPKNFMDLSFSTPGRVVEVLVADGAAVKTGDVIARLAGIEARQADLAKAQQALLAANQAIDDLKSKAPLVTAQAASAVADAQKAVDVAQETLNKLKDTSGTAQVDLDQAQAHLDLAKAQLGAAEDHANKLQDGIDPDALSAAQASQTAAQTSVTSAQVALDALELRAPANGTLTGFDLQAGEFIPAGQPVATLVDFSSWVVKTDDLTELEVVKVSSGQSVTVILDALPSAPMSGKITQIAPRFEEKRGDVTYTLTIALDNPAQGALWGMTGQVQFGQGK